MSYIKRDLGLSFTRGAIALGLSQGRQEDAVVYASKKWGPSSEPALILRAALGNANTGGDEIDWDASGDEFIEAVTPQTIIGKLRGLRNVPANVPFAASSDVATAYWTAEGKATPVSRMAFDRKTLSPLKTAALVVFSEDLLKASNGEELVRRDLVRACAKLTDQTFINNANAGIAGQMPAGITNGAAAIVSSGDIADDIGAAIAAFEGDFQFATWVLHPKLAAKIGLRAAGAGVAADLGARGGNLAGLPAIVSEGCPINVISLVDASAVAIVDQGAEVSVSKQASVEMDTAPTGDSTTPAASANSMVSLFATDSVGLIVTRKINWLLGRTNAAVLITGAAYAGV